MSILYLMNQRLTDSSKGTALALTAGNAFGTKLLQRTPSEEFQQQNKTILKSLKALGRRNSTREANDIRCANDMRYFKTTV